MRKILLFVIGMFSTVVLAENNFCGVSLQNDLLGIGSDQPFIDKTKNMVPIKGSGKLELTPLKPGEEKIFKLTAGADFRINCKPSHMSNDDPLVFPFNPGTSHHHTFYGNTSVTAFSNLDNLLNVGNSSCFGGIANRSSYWHPSMVDGADGTPIKPEGMLVYYKKPYQFDPLTIQDPPAGLRFLIGNPKGKTPEDANVMLTGFQCFNDVSGGGAGIDKPTKHIPACSKGNRIVMAITFPRCWDGKNLDSPDHKSHVGYDESYNKATGFRECAATHPVELPGISMNVSFRVTSDFGTANWRLASDNYKKDGYNSGYSIHADYVVGWQPGISKQIRDTCYGRTENTTTHNCGTNYFGTNEVMRPVY